LEFVTLAAHKYFTEFFVQVQPPMQSQNMCVRDTDTYILNPKLISKFIYCSIKSNLKMTCGKSSDMMFFFEGLM